jgi:hypothetical protein
MDETAASKTMSPVLWLAVLAFIAGFLGYLALGGAGALYPGHEGAQPEMASGPASEDWNIPKDI